MMLSLYILVAFDTMVIFAVLSGIAILLTRPQISTLIAAVAHMPDAARTANPSDIARMTIGVAEGLSKFTVPDDEKES